MRLNLLIFFSYFLMDRKGNSSTGEKDQHSLTKESAAAILTDALNAINVRYITEGQLCPASKTLKLGLKTTVSKDEYVVPVASALIKLGLMKI